MFGFVLGVLLGCTPDQKETAVQDSAVEDTSPITGDECSYRIGEHICNVTLPDVDLNYQELYSYYGRPIVIQLAAEWCAPCHAAGKFAEPTMEQWAGEDLLWITIILENDQRENPNAQDLAEWSISAGIDQSLLWAGTREMIDPTAENGFPLTSWPTFVMLTEDLLVYHAFSGFSEGYLDQKISELMFYGG